MSSPWIPLDTRLPDLLRSGNRLRGIFNSISCPAIVEMCAFAGFDFIIIDNEHGSSDLQTTEHMLRAARASGIVPIVRCLEHDIPRILDMGASGVQIPMVRDAAHAAELVQRLRYPLPGGQGGQRGSAFSTRAAGYGAFGGTAHTARSNSGIALIAMIETPEAAVQATSIAQVDGVDGVFIGPNDLAHSMGYENRWNDPAVQAVIERAVQAIATTGKCPGILALNDNDTERYAAWGARYFATVSTGIITAALHTAAQGNRRKLTY